MIFAAATLCCERGSERSTGGIASTRRGIYLFAVSRLSRSQGPACNEALTPVPRSGRVFGWRSHLSLWFSLGVGLLVMQVGAYLVPGVGTREALTAVLLGSLGGAALLAWAARVGCETGLSSAGLMHQVYGTRFARLPILLNIVQLAGWTTFELVVMSDGTAAIGNRAFGWPQDSAMAQAAGVLLWGGVLLLLLTGSMVALVRRFVARIGLPLVILSLLWLTWQFVGATDLTAFWNRRGDGTMTMASAFDLVIAMPVSWLPLIADYARYGRSGRGAFWGAWLGYACANAWCYALGLLVITAVEPGGSLVSALLLAQGGLIALGLILVDELDNAYGDVHSASVSVHSMVPRWNVRRWGLALGGVCVVLALVLPVHGLEPFLLMLSSVFVPLYGVILGRLGGKTELTAQVCKIDGLAVGLWILGIAVFHGFPVWFPGWGSTIPSLLVTLPLARLTRSRETRAVR